MEAKKPAPQPAAEPESLELMLTFGGSGVSLPEPESDEVSRDSVSFDKVGVKKHKKKAALVSIHVNCSTCMFCIVGGGIYQTIAAGQ